MEGHAYEYACARYLQSRGFTNIEVTKASGDQGLDIVAHKDGKKYGIQCKNYSRPVGNKAVQEAYSGAQFYKCDKAAVITNNTFTKSAKELAASTGVELWEKVSDEIVTKAYKKHEISLIPAPVIILLIVLRVLLLAVGILLLFASPGYGIILMVLSFLIWFICAFVNSRKENIYPIAQKYQDLMSKYGIDVQPILDKNSISIGEVKALVKKTKATVTEDAKDRRSLKKLERRLCRYNNQLVDDYYEKHPQTLIDENQYFK